MSAQENRQITIAAVNRDLEKMLPQFSAALPAHIPPERFKRVAQTAINQNPDLVNGDRQALWAACMRAAQDGLLPDGREGALVMFKGKPAWMPMVGGIIKKMRNSGELASISAHPVYQNDEFLYSFGDDERIEHRPHLGSDAGQMIAVYAIAKLKDGTIQREVMTRAEVDKVKASSPSGNNGPWGKWYEEMARKTVVRRLSKYLPMSTDLERMMADLDVMAGAEDHRAERSVDTAPPRPTRASVSDGAPATIDNETGEVMETEMDLTPFAQAALGRLRACTTEAELAVTWESLDVEVCRELGSSALEEERARISAT